MVPVAPRNFPPRVISGRVAAGLRRSGTPARRSCLVSPRAPVTKIVAEKDVSDEEFQGSELQFVRPSGCEREFLAVPPEGGNAERASWIVSHQFSRRPAYTYRIACPTLPALMCHALYGTLTEAKVARPAADARLRNDPSGEEINLGGFSRSVQEASIGEDVSEDVPEKFYFPQKIIRHATRDRENVRIIFFPALFTTITVTKVCHISVRRNLSRTLFYR